MVTIVFACVQTDEIFYQSQAIAAVSCHWKKGPNRAYLAER